MNQTEPTHGPASRLHLAVEGIVQGVGFRPFVVALANRMGLNGFVGNDTTGVFIEVEGPPAVLSAFVAALSVEAPPLARVDRVRQADMTALGDTAFAIVASEAAPGRDALVTADAGTCDDCRREITDPSDRRFGYPFTNCTNCGPRYTIVRDVPYDRGHTTMAGFTMCAACQSEYDDPGDRRFHAQPVCCWACGPQLSALDATGTPLAGEPIGVAAERLLVGEIVAVKGLGGYHLAVDATNEAGVARLRGRKHREDRPFALMVADLDAALTLCAIDHDEGRLLASPARPIVLLRRRPDADVAPSVAPRTRELGVMLPYTPVHHLLLAAVGRPIVLTSGNLSDEPIAFVDDDALRRLGPVADLFLTHDRPIETRVDDSVMRAVGGRPLMLRRSRGFVPSPIAVPWTFARPVLACGSELKNTFCLGRGHHAFLSHHIGDLENYETLTSFTTGIEHLSRLFAVTPAVVAYDLHPDYLSTKYALDLPGVDLIGVQHHHAHIASCLADNGVDGPVIGVAFDGTGYGIDGTVWGGEFLIAALADAVRVGRLQPVPLPGGAAAIREPWRMLASYLDVSFDGTPPALEIAQRHAARWDAVRAAATAGINSPLTSSAGRLFDAVACLLEVRDDVTYEGQAAIELEQLADLAESGSYDAAMYDNDGLLTLSGADLVRAVLADRQSGLAPATIAARFHNGVAAMIVRTCRTIRDRHELSIVALSGGVFQNLLLVTRCVEGLEAAGFSVLTHRQVPPNDGGISLGQAVVAAARDRLEAGG